MNPLSILKMLGTASATVKSLLCFCLFASPVPFFYSFQPDLTFFKDITQFQPLIGKTNNGFWNVFPYVSELLFKQVDYSKESLFESVCDLDFDKTKKVAHAKLVKFGEKVEDFYHEYSTFFWDVFLKIIFVLDFVYMLDKLIGLLNRIYQSIDKIFLANSENKSSTESATTEAEMLELEKAQFINDTKSIKAAMKRADPRRLVSVIASTDEVTSQTTIKENLINSKSSIKFNPALAKDYYGAYATVKKMMSENFSDQPEIILEELKEGENSEKENLYEIVECQSSDSIDDLDCFYDIRDENEISNEDN